MATSSAAAAAAAAAPSFLDRFILHLATKLGLLNDPEQIQTWLLNSGRRRPLYWRSHLLQEPPSNHNDNPKLAFVDLTFECMTHDNDGPPLELQVRFGYLFLESSSSSRYYRCQPLTQSLLDSHAHSIGLELSTATPQAMASLLSEAFSNVEPAADKVRLVDNDDDNTRIRDDGLWYYPQVDESGKWTILVESTSSLDAVATILLYLNMKEMTTIPKSTSADEVLVERKLEACWNHLRLEQRRRVAATGDSVTEDGMDKVPLATLVPSADNATTTTSNHNNGTTKKRAAGAYVSIVDGSKKRKKKGKIVYAKPSS